jgi:hypothetical protein
MRKIYILMLLTLAGAEWVSGQTFPPPSPVACTGANCTFPAGSNVTIKSTVLPDAYATLTSTVGVPYSVKAFGAKGDGSTDDTAAFAATIVAAAGKTIRVPPGIYMLDNLAITTTAVLELDAAATLKHRSSGSQQAIALTGSLTIRGGNIDGNKSEQTLWTNFITASNLVSGTALRISRVTVINTLQSLVQVYNFGGLLELEYNDISNMAEHGTGAYATAVVFIESGQASQKGLFRFNHNKVIAVVPAVNGDGASPGGIFYSVRDDTNDLSHGNGSTLEAIGNYFYGIGQNFGPNVISPIHTYPQVGEAHIMGNYFEACGFSAMSLKSVTNVVVEGNTIINGQTTTQNIWTEGAIGYEPGYQAIANSRPRATISNNIVDTPGGQTGAAKQTCISLHGTATSYATDVTVVGNVLAGCSVGVYADYLTDAAVTGNHIRGASGGTAHTENGIEMHHVNGDVSIANNVVKTSNGLGVTVTDTSTTANFSVRENTVTTTDAETYAATLRGVNLAKFSGNTFSASSATAVFITADGSGNKVQMLAWDASNTVVAGVLTFDYPNIVQAFLPVSQASTWQKYLFTFIATGVNGCVNANGCIQVTSPNGSTSITASAAAPTQQLQFTTGTANFWLQSAQIKTKTACTNAGGIRVLGLGDATDTTYYTGGAMNYDLTASVSSTNLWNATMAKTGGGTAAVNYVTARINSAIGTVDGTAAGCAFEIRLLTSVAP